MIAPPAASAPYDPHVALRTICGVPAATAVGEVRLYLAPHHPLDPLVSAVARREGGRWRVSWVCQGTCGAVPSVDCDVREGDLDPAAAAVVERLAAGALVKAPPPPPFSPAVLCGWNRLDAGGAVRTAPDCASDPPIVEAEAALKRPR